MNMGDRKLQILKFIIDDFISTAQPIGSRTIAKKYTLGLSSATIRNEMADLEELGYLEQPHTSAGRVPSDLGYRLYVDSLMKQGTLGTEQKQIIQSLLMNRIIEVDDVISQATKLLSNMTHMTSFISLPLFKKSKLANMKLVKINDSKVLLILVSDSGVVKSIQLGLRDVEQDVLDNISNGLLKRLLGATIEDINVKKISGLKLECPDYGSVVDYLIPILKDTLRDIDDVELCLEGAKTIFDLPEFHDVIKAKQFLMAIENKDLLYQVIRNLDDKGINVKIGAEIGVEEFKECSVVGAAYHFNDESIGRIGVLGPTRMEYGKIISVVDYIRKTLSDIFSGIYL